MITACCTNSCVKDHGSEIHQISTKCAEIIASYRTVGVVNRLERRSVTCDNAQLPMLSEPCSCWPVAASVGSGH